MIVNCIVHMHITAQIKAYWLVAIIKISIGCAYYNHTSICVSMCPYVYVSVSYRFVIQLLDSLTHS